MKNYTQKIENIFKHDVYELVEGTKVRGYEVNTYTDGGVNIILFFDMGSFKTFTWEDIVREIKKYISDFNVDEQIDLLRQDKNYCNAFTISESVNDFRDYKEWLEDQIKDL